MSNYPLGAKNDPSAPFNQVELPPIKTDVLVSITLSKSVDIDVYDYTIDEDGNINFSESALEQLVKDQIYLPHEASTYLRISPKNEVILKDLDDWWVDDFVVIKE